MMKKFMFKFGMIAFFLFAIGCDANTIRGDVDATPVDAAASVQVTVDASVDAVEASDAGVKLSTGSVVVTD